MSTTYHAYIQVATSLPGNQVDVARWVGQGGWVTRRNKYLETNWVGLSRPIETFLFIFQRKYLFNTLNMIIKRILLQKYLYICVKHFTPSPFYLKFLI